MRLVLLLMLSAVLGWAQGGLVSGPAATSQSSITQHTVSHGYTAPAHTHHTYVAPVAQLTYVAPVAKHVVAEVYAPPHYDFEYSVHDPHTGDVKEQKESRKDDQVHGYYSLVEPDGSKRIVEYTADAHNGFNAVVHREHSQHPTQVKVAVAPVAVKYAPAIIYHHH